MKTISILFSLTLLLTFTSCNDNVTISKAEYQKLKGDTVNSEYPKPFKLHVEGLSYPELTDGIVLGSDNHEYLVINYGYNSCNIEHYVECKLCRGRESLIK